MNARTSSLLSAATLLALAPALLGQGVPPDQLQTISAGSTYTHAYCLGPCDCAMPPSVGQLTGTFKLVYAWRDQWTVHYDVTHVDLHSATDREPTVWFVGSGTYSIGGDFAYTHQLVLNLVAVLEEGNPPYTFDSGVKIVASESQFPSIVIDATTGLTGCEERTLSIRTTAAETPGCPADIGAAGADRSRDGNLDNNDFIVFIGYFFEGNPRADRGVAGGEIGSDGEFDNNDFIAFIDQFFAGC